MLLTLIRIFLGVDMALGFFNYAAWSWLAGKPFNVCLLCLSIFSTHLPDWDMIPFLVFRRRYRLISHWGIGHHPLLLLPLVAMASFCVSRIWMAGAVGYIVGMVCTGVFLHFAHDGVGKLGFPWLSPFCMTRLRFRGGKFSLVPQNEIDEWNERVALWERHEPSAADEISVRTPPMTLTQVVFWGMGVMAVVIFIVGKGLGIGRS